MRTKFLETRDSSSLTGGKRSRLDLNQLSILSHRELSQNLRQLIDHGGNSLNYLNFTREIFGMEMDHGQETRSTCLCIQGRCPPG